MTPTDPELVTRLRAVYDEMYVGDHDMDLLKAAADALDSAHQREAGYLVALTDCNAALAAARQREEALARAIRDASPSAANRPPSRETTVTLVSDLRGDTQSLVDQIGAAEARVQQLEAALTKIKAIALKMEEHDDWLVAAHGTDIFDVIDEVGRADTQEPAHGD